MFGRPGGAAAGTTNAELAADRRRRGSIFDLDSASPTQLDDQARKLRAEATFNDWVRWKDRFDRGLELFNKLGASRAESDVSVATSCSSLDLQQCVVQTQKCALDCLLLPRSVVACCRCNVPFQSFVGRCEQHLKHALNNPSCTNASRPATAALNTNNRRAGRRWQ
jgi:hypothetical protein